MRTLSRPALILCLLLAEFGGVNAGVIQRIFCGAVDGGFTSYARDHTVGFTADGSATLAPFAYQTGVLGNRLIGHRLKVAAAAPARRVFNLDPGPAGAELFLFGSKPEAQWHGQPLAFDKFINTGGWLRAELPAARLKAGENELRLTGGQLAMDADRQPAAHSFVSPDSGETWQPAPGEFLLNLRLALHPPAGALWSEVMDLWAINARELIPSDTSSIGQLAPHMAADLPPGTEARLLLRTGATPQPDPTWTPWAPTLTRLQRYLQWRVELATRDPRVAPVLRQLTFDVQADEPRPALPGRLVEHHTATIRRPSAPYTYQRPSARLTELRTKYKLDEVIAPGKTEFEQLLLLRNWVRRQWPCNDAGSGVRTWDALEILGAPDKQHGMCVHFGNAFSQCANALGFVARPVVLTNHFVADVWSNEYRRWVLMDVEAVHPEGFRRYGTAHYLDAKTQEPLDLLTLHRAVHRTLAADAAARDAATASGAELPPAAPVAGVTQAYDVDTDAGPHTRQLLPRTAKELRIFERFALVPRNNHLDQLTPWEEFHGQDHYHSNQYWWWYGDTPQGREIQYPIQVTREADLFWSVNEVALSLTATGKPDAVVATLVTFTPNFARFEVRVDGGEWQPVPGQAVDPDDQWALFPWALRPGDNRLEVRAVNRFARPGPPSSALLRLPAAAPAPAPLPW